MAHCVGDRGAVGEKGELKYVGEGEVFGRIDGPEVVC